MPKKDEYCQFSLRLTTSEMEVLRRRVDEVNESARESTGFPGRHTVASLSRQVLVDWAVGPLGPNDPEREPTRQTVSSAPIDKARAALRGAKG